MEYLASDSRTVFIGQAVAVPGTAMSNTLTDIAIEKLIELPVAVGTAIAIKRKDEDSKVYCFMGDMTSETGIAHECIK